MTTISLLTPPMDESEPLQHEIKYEYNSQFRVLPPFSGYEQERLRSLGFHDFEEFYNRHPNDPNYNVHVRQFFAKSKKYLEQYISDMKRLYKKHKFKTMERRIFFARARICQVVLMAMDWTGALELYQELLAEDPEKFSKLPDLYWGLGMVYLHFKQWRPAIEAFNRLLYCHPNGRITVEVRIRLAMCYQEIQDYERALRLYYLCLHDVDESKFMNKSVLKYNIAACNENFGELETADVSYRKLIVDFESYEKFHTHGNVNDEMKDQLRVLTAAANRQIGWIYYRKAYKDEKNRMELLKKAQERLMKAIEINPADGKNYYYLGRVYGGQANGNDHMSTMLAGILPGGTRNPLGLGQLSESAHDAFLNFRLSIDKQEQNENCWCSIGALYQKQNQPMDALQAFICAIELNPRLTAAWVDLGELYEKNCQYQDALECFKSAMKNYPVAPIPIKARVTFLEKELNVTNRPTKPANHMISDTFNMVIPSLKEAYEQPIPLELRNRQNSTYEEGLAHYDNAFYHVWFNNRIMSGCFETDWVRPDPKPMEDLEVRVMEMMRANEPLLVKAERQVYECLITSSLVYQNNILEFCVPEACLEMPRVSEEMIQRLAVEGHLIDNPRCYEYDFLPKCFIQPLPASFSLLSKLYVPIDITSEELMAMLHKKATNPTYNPVFEEFAHLPKAPELPLKPIATEEEVKAALEKNERHPLIMKTPILTVDNRKEAQSLELQRYLDNSTISCIRGLTSCLRLDLSLFSTKTVAEIDPNQEIRVLTQYHIPAETNCDHAGQPTWDCINHKSSTTVIKYAQYQIDTFRHTLKRESEKVKRSGGRGPSPKRMKLMASAQNKIAPTPPKDLKYLKFGTRVNLADDVKWGKQISELSKLPAFCRLIAGSNMLSHLGHQVQGMNTVSLDMKVPGARITAHQENNNVAAVNINVGPGDCEWFAVPYEYSGKIEEMCKKKQIDFLKGSYWPVMTDLLDAGIPVHRFTQKAGDMVYVPGGTLFWVQSTGWCNNISWNVAPMNNHQLTISLRSYEYNRLRSYKSLVPMQMLCWQLAKNVKFTNPMIYNTCRGVLIRSLSYIQMMTDWLNSLKKSIKVHPKTAGEPAHFCMSCLAEVFSIMLVKEVGSSFSVFCAYCAKQQNMDEFIALQQIPTADLVKIYDNMKYISPATLNNQKQSFTA
ncbi:unnamed protein product [Caenorhabditis brenneri]